MRTTNLIEIIGFVIFILGFILQIVHDKIETNPISTISKEYQLFYWGGLAIWAIGTMKKQADLKRKKDS